MDGASKRIILPIEPDIYDVTITDVKGFEGKRSPHIMWTMELENGRNVFYICSLKYLFTQSKLIKILGGRKEVFDFKYLLKFIGKTLKVKIEHEFFMDRYSYKVTPLERS